MTPNISWSDSQACRGHRSINNDSTSGIRFFNCLKLGLVIQFNGEQIYRVLKSQGPTLSYTALTGGESSGRQEGGKGEEEEEILPRKRNLSKDVFDVCIDIKWKPQNSFLF